MLATIYYFTGLLLILMNINLVINLPKYLYLREFVTKFKKVTKKQPTESDFNVDEYGFFSATLVTELFNITWFFFGLIGANWLVFIIFFVQNTFFNVVGLISKSKLLTNLSLSLKVLITFTLLCILVFNHFHFKVNLTNFILR
jgi:hypothetical protein